MIKTGKPLILILPLCVLGVFVYLFFNWDGVIKEISKGEVEKEREKWERVVKRLEADIATSKKEAEERKPGVPGEKISELFGYEFVQPLEKEKVDCEKLRQQVTNFFGYLDGKDYIKKFRLKNGTIEHYNKVMAELSQEAPMVSEVVLDFETLMLNAVHFYRVLGKKNIQMIKEILAIEGENLEMIMGVFFEYFKANDRCQDKEFFVPPPAVRYEYAGFFLNTLGGKAYLFRRNSRIRILANYYSVLVLHEANEKVLNRHGIDIQPHLNRVIEETSARNDLIFQKRYLETLYEIKNKYPSFKAAME